MTNSPGSMDKALRQAQEALRDDRSDTVTGHAEEAQYGGNGYPRALGQAYQKGRADGRREEQWREERYWGGRGYSGGNPYYYVVPPIGRYQGNGSWPAVPGNGEVPLPENLECRWIPAGPNGEGFQLYSPTHPCPDGRPIPPIPYRSR